MTPSLVHLVRRPSAPSQHPPLLILLHGVGANERGMGALAPSFDPRFVVVSARSPIALGPGAFAWFHVTFTPNGPVIDAAEAAAGWARLAAFVDECVAVYDADPARVYLAGFSQGGIIALATLLTSPDRIAGAVSMSGRVLPEVLPHAGPTVTLVGKPALVLHGVRDDKLPVAFARNARERLTALGLTVGYRELDMGHEITQESLNEATSWLTARLDAAD